jgi:hypothetical protein
MRYDVLAITDLSLALSDRRFDGEMVIVLRRVNRAEHDQQQATKYQQRLESVERLAKGE